MTVNPCVPELDIYTFDEDTTPDALIEPVNDNSVPLKVRFASALAVFEVPKEVSTLSSAAFVIVLNPVPELPLVPLLPELPLDPDEP